MTKKFKELELNSSWNIVFDNVNEDLYFKSLIIWVKSLPKHITAPINKKDIFNCFNLCNWNDLKLVFISNPSSNIQGFNGLCIGGNTDFTNVPSAINLEKVMKLALKKENFFIADKTLKTLAGEGVLFLPTQLTFSSNREENKLHNFLWDKFVKMVIYKVDQKSNHLPFVFLGKDLAKKYLPIIKHRIKRKNIAYILDSFHVLNLYPGESLGMIFNGIDNFITKNNKTNLEWNKF